MSHEHPIPRSKPAWATAASLLAIALLLPATTAGANPPLYLSHHWHMHQPIYWPYEPVTDTEAGGAYGFSVLTVHHDRGGPYTSWPLDAVQAGAGFDHLGAQVSLSGSLMENLDAIEAAGQGFDGWRDRWIESADWTTSLGNPRVDLVSFGYHHPLMALLDPQALVLQVELHRVAMQRTLGITPGPGMFPPECAFTPRMIPALEQAGIQWIMVDSIHVERGHLDYPYSAESNLVPPNGADMWNDAETDWIWLQDLWAPSPVAAPWAYRPHHAVYLDPDTGEEHRIVVVPAARYEGNEDARGGYGALLYDNVFTSYLAQNTDPDHPMLALLAHDGDNYGGGTESYYHHNFDGYLGWLGDNAGTFDGTTVQDYLDQFPPDADDTIHVENGAWSGADNGDAEFAKWNGDPDPDGYSPDRASWAVMTAALNHVLTAEAILPHTSAEAILDGTGSNTDWAWRWLLVGQTSCYWYWDGAEGGIWDSHPTRAANQAVAAAGQVIADGGDDDPLGPSIYPPQREPYNPGALEWGQQPMPSEFQVWTLVHDVSGLDGVELHVRVDDDGCRDAGNEVYAGGGWDPIPMTAVTIEPQTDPPPVEVATGYEAAVDVDPGVLVDYYVEATDARGNVTRSAISHVVVGTLGSSSGPWEPENPTHDDVITVFANHPGALHWGVDGWVTPDPVYWPTGTVDWGDGHAVETPLQGPDGDGGYWVEIGPFNDLAQTVSHIDFVFHWDDDSWSSPDQLIPLGARGDRGELPQDCVPYYRSGGYVGDDDDAGDDDAGDDDGASDDDGAGDDDDTLGDPPAGHTSSCACQQPGSPLAAPALALPWAAAGLWVVRRRR